MRIGLDLQGSDQSPQTLIDGAYEALKLLPQECSLVLIGLPETLSLVKEDPRIELQPASEEVTMEDAPLLAVRRKKDSSISVGTRLVRERQIDALVSTGNTGALVASAALRLPTLPGVERPGLLAVLPTLTGSVAVIDIGANVDPKPEHLYQFARMGAAYQQCSEGVERARVGLLNIGTEALKGTRAIRETYNLFRDQTALNFVGNIEGREAFSGVIDVLVTGGFVGNIFLKTAEGISNFILQHLRDFFGDALTPRVEEALQTLDSYFNYAEYPGAIVCGVDGLVIKCHGFSSTRAIVNGLKGAAHLLQQDLLASLSRAL